MRTQLILVALAAIILVAHGAAVANEQKVPAIWSKLLKMSREERVETMTKALNTQSILDNQVVNLINSIISSPSADPLNIAYVNVNISQDFVHLKGNLDTIVTTGISGLLINKMSINPLYFKGDFEFQLPELTIAGNYDVTGVAAGLLPIYGKGPFSVWLKNAKVAGSVNMATNLSIKTLVLDFGLEDFHVDFQMLLGDPDLSDVVNDMINDLGMQYLTQFKSSIESYTAEFIKTKYNNFVAGKSVGEIVEMATGGKSGINAQSECKPY